MWRSGQSAAQTRCNIMYSSSDNRVQAEETAKQRDDAEFLKEKLPGPSKGLTAKLPDNLPTKELPNIQPTESTAKNNPVIIRETSPGAGATPVHADCIQLKSSLRAENNLVITLDDQPGDSVTTPSPVPSGTWDDPVVVDNDTDTSVSSFLTSAKKRKSEESPKKDFNNIMGHQKFCDNCDMMTDDMIAQLKSCKSIIEKVMMRGKKRMRGGDQIDI